MRPGPARPGGSDVNAERRVLRQLRRAAGDGCGWDETAPRVGAQDGVIGFAGVRDRRTWAAREQSPRGECLTGRERGRPGQRGPRSQGSTRKPETVGGPACTHCSVIQQVCCVQTLRQLLPWVLGTRQGVAPAPLRLRGATHCRGGGGCGPVQGEVGSGQGSLGS